MIDAIGFALIASAFVPTKFDSFATAIIGIAAVALLGYACFTLV